MMRNEVAIWDKIGEIIEHSSVWRFISKNSVSFKVPHKDEYMIVDISIPEDYFFGLWWLCKQKTFEFKVSKFNITAVFFKNSQFEIDALQLNMNTPEHISDKLMKKLLEFNQDILSKNEKTLETIHDFLITNF